MEPEKKPYKGIRIQPTPTTLRDLERRIFLQTVHRITDFTTCQPVESHMWPTQISCQNKDYAFGCGRNPIAKDLQQGGISRKLPFVL